MSVGRCPSTSAGVNGGAVDLLAEVRSRGSTPALPDAPEGAAGAVQWVYRDANSCSSSEPIAAQVACRNDLTVTLDGTGIPFQPITIADLESFRPAPPAPVTEPNGWAIVDLPANFVARTEQQVVPGVLLGEPAEVRFTPVAYTWDYGDGTERTTTEAGAPWDVLGAEELTPTPTSHIYAERGRVEVALTVAYTAEYRFLGPAWIPVVGTLNVTTSPFAVSVVTADTMLVAGDCRTTDGPGC